jgi:hypothetical protein
LVAVPAIGLDHEGVGREVEVGLEAWVLGGIERVVAQRPRQAVFAGEPAHAAVQLAARPLGVGRDRFREPPGASVAIGSRDHVSDRCVVVDAEFLRLRERPLEVVLWGVAGDIQQRAVHGRDRDALMAGGVLGIEGTRTVQADSRDPVPGRGGGHLGAGRVVPQEIPVHRRAEMAEHRAVP